jgi:hypothetical protein
MIELLQEKAEPMMRELRDIAATHVDLSKGKFVLLDYDPAKYPGQEVLSHTIKGTPLAPTDANGLAEAVDERYTKLYAAVNENSFTSVISDTLRSGHNAVNATDHAELIDIALEALAFSSVMKIRQGYATKNDLEEQKRAPFRTGIIVSRMADFLGIPMLGGVVPARDLLANGFDKTYMPIPSNLRTRGRFERRAMSTYNNLVVGEISGDMEKRAFSNRRPMFLSHAAPGSINKLLEGTDSIVVGQINYRIADFMKQALTWTSSAKLSSEKGDVLIHERPLCVAGPNDVEELAQRIVELLKRRDPDQDFIYDKDGNLPTVRIEHN